jgi:hypothetical protein
LAAIQQKRVLTPRDAAEGICGISLNTLYEYWNANCGPESYYDGKSRLIDRADSDAWWAKVKAGAIKLPRRSRRMGRCGNK